MIGKKVKAASLLRTMWCIGKDPMKRADIISHITDVEIRNNFGCLINYLIKEGFVVTSVSAGITLYKVVDDAIKTVYYNGNATICNIGYNGTISDDEINSTGNSNSNSNSNINSSVWIDLIKTLNNYKNDLGKLYMHKKGTAFNLNCLLSVSGLDLTNNGKLSNATFTEQLKLKDELHTKITNVNRENIFFWIVYEWGGVKKNKSSSVTTFANAYNNSNGNMNQLVSIVASKGERVASWSKILSFLYPHDYFIYDARVAFTLDYLLGKKKYPVPSGSNTVINAHVDGSRQPTLDEYKEYCSQIKNIHSELWPEGDEKDKPYLTEMLIFSLLEDVGFCASIPEKFKLVF